nr:MarR family transcriptional regulator [uncultured Acidithrix sp.]
MCDYHISVTGHYTLAETEKTMEARLSGLPIDFVAQSAIANLYRAANSTRKYFTNTVLRPIGLSWTGFVVLWVVWIWDGIEVRHASEEAGISKSTLSGVIKTMEARGFIERITDQTDRRLVHLKVTESGTEVVTDLFPKFNQQETFAVSCLSRSSIESFTTNLRQIISHLEAQMIDVDVDNHSEEL